MSDQIARQTTSTNPKIDPQDVAHHLRVAADKYHELSRHLLEQMNEAVGAVADEQKPAFRHTRESLAKLFDEQASDAIRLALLFEDTDAAELVAALESIASGNARAAAQNKIRRVRVTLVAGKVDRPAIPEGRDTPASDHELTTAIAAAVDPTACENEGSLQHTPSIWIGNEQVNRRVGGEA